MNPLRRKNSATPGTAARRIRQLSGLRPSLALVLGSGFHHALDAFEEDARIPYGALPGFPRVSVAGHAGELLIGHLSGTPTLILSGRCHYYEGHSFDAVTFSIRTLAACEIRDLLLTNAAGGINRGFRPGDLVLLTDHINLMGGNPLRGVCPEGLPRFVDLTRVYSPSLGKLLERAAASRGLKLHKGVYLAVSGPSYETPAEIRAFARLGADAVGMSTVPEAIVARQCGLNVAGLSCITNLAAGRSPKPLSHGEVLDAACKSGPAAANLLSTFARLYAKTH